MFDEKLPKTMIEAILKNCNAQIEELIIAIQHIAQYVICFNLIIPKKYKLRVTNELEMLNENPNTNISYQFEDRVDNEDFVVLTIFNLGVMEKESFMLKDKYDL